MMNLAIVAATVLRPEPASASAVAAAQTYRHLRSAAGLQSMPPSQSHRHALGWQPPHGATWLAADGEPAQALALRAAQTLAAALDEPTRVSVDSLVHCQLTLDEHPLTSICLRAAFAHFPSASNVFGIGQLGGAALGTGLQLAASHAADGLGATVLTAADKWVAPFDRHFGDLATLSDGAAALLVDHGDAHPDTWARVRGTATALMPHGRAMWERTPADLADDVAIAVAQAARAALAQAGWSADAVTLMAGDDSFGLGVPQRVAAALGVAPPLDPEPARVHLSTAAFADSLLRCAEASRCSERALRCLIWSATPGGAATAAAIHIDATQARLHNGVFAAARSAAYTHPALQPA